MASSNEAQECSLASETAPLSQANNHLAVSLLKILAKEEGNIFFSPFSLSTALAMLFYGTRGETGEEMRGALGYELSNIRREEVPSHFRQLLSTLEKSQDQYIIAYANCILSHKDFFVKDEYKGVMSDHFKALLLEVDFVNELDKVIIQINDWVKEKTHNMIPNLLNSLEPNTVMVLLNAIYFKGNWLRQFDVKLTQPQLFYNHGKEDNVKEVSMMNLQASFPYGEKELFKVLQLPYKGNEVAMLILLPRSLNGLEELESTITPTFIQDLRKDMHKMEVKITLPKFRLEYSKSMKESFQQLGFHQIFKCGADLGGISDCKALELSEIIHKAVLEVNEEGCEAAAATALIVLRRSIPRYPKFVVDHPFLFALYDIRNDLVLFIGRVSEL